MIIIGQSKTSPSQESTALITLKELFPKGTAGNTKIQAEWRGNVDGGVIMPISALKEAITL